jgi:GNAT superfamily N-acetyltransferase
MHRLMVAEEEFKELKMARINRRLDKGKKGERSATLAALCPAAWQAPGSSSSSNGSDSSSGEEQLDSRLVLGSGSGGRSRSSSSSSSSGEEEERWGLGVAAAAEDAAVALVGSLDLYAVRALNGEVLIGNSQNAAYLANVCTAGAARRRGVGQALLQEARRLALTWGACHIPPGEPLHCCCCCCCAAALLRLACCSLLTASRVPLVACTCRCVPAPFRSPPILPLHLAQIIPCRCGRLVCAHHGRERDRCALLRAQRL